MKKTFTILHTNDLALGLHRTTHLSRSDDQTAREVLARLSTFVQWAGRYPVPIKKKDTAQSRMTRSNDFVRIKLFLGRLDKEFNK